MTPPTNLSATRLGWLREEALKVLAAGRWTDSRNLLKRVRNRWTWATDAEIISAVDQLWDEGRIDSRNVGPQAVTQWKLLGS